MPFAAGVGVELEMATAEQVTGRLAWSADRCTAGGMLHGGALMTLADSVGAICAYLNLPSGATTSTLSSSTAFLRAVRTVTPGRLLSRCTSGGRPSSSRSKSATTTTDLSPRSSRPRRSLPAGHPSQLDARRPFARRPLLDADDDDLSWMTSQQKRGAREGSPIDWLTQCARTYSVTWRTRWRASRAPLSPGSGPDS